MAKEITVGLTTTPEQKLDVYRLRYKVYVEDLCLVPEFANHQEKTLKEPLDEHAKIFCAASDGRVIGTMRINLGRDGRMEHESLYDLDKFLPFYPAKVAMATKFAIAREKRGGEVARHLLHAAYGFLLENSIQFVFIDCWPHLLNLYEHLGFRRYRSNIRHPEAGYMTPMVLVTEDIRHLELVGSPLLEVAKKHPNSDIGREHFARCFPDFMQYGCQTLLTNHELLDLLSEKISGDLSDVAKLFAVMPEEEAEIFARAGNIVSCKAGDRIISFGEMRREIYTVLSGSVSVRSESDNAVLMVMSKGDTFGEAAYLGDTARTAHVTAHQDCELLVHDGSSLTALERNHPAIAAKMYKNMARILSARLTKTNNEAASLRARMERMNNLDDKYSVERIDSSIGPRSCND